MQLLEKKIGFPSLGFNDVKITLTAPHNPTAVDKVTVKVIGRFANDGVYGHLPLRKVFSDFLGVPDPDFILRKTLDELLVKGIIRCEHSCRNMPQQQVRSFSLTERGQRLQRENILYGVAQERFEDYQYDPIAGKLLDESFGWKPQKPQTAIDETAFMQRFPSSLIQKNLTHNKPDWFTPQTKIETVEATAEPTVLWKEQSFTLNVEYGSLLVECSGSNVSPSYAEYINDLSADTLFGLFFENSFGDGWEDCPIMSSEEFEELSAEDWWIPAKGRLDKFADNPNVVSFDPDWKGYRFGNNRLRFDPRLDKPVKIFSQKDSRHISVQGEYPFDDAICVTDRYALQRVRVPVRFNGEHLELPVVLRHEYRKENRFVADFLKDAVVLANKGNQRYENNEWGDYMNDWQKLMNKFWHSFT